jgi:hypothetical protein
MKSPIPKERLRVSNWIVQRLYNDAVNETVELRLLAVFQHVVDPARVCTVADKNSACANSLPIPDEAPVTSAQGPNLFYRARLSSFRSVLPA